MKYYKQIINKITDISMLQIYKIYYFILFYVLYFMKYKFIIKMIFFFLKVYDFIIILFYCLEQDYYNMIFYLKDKKKKFLKLSFIKQILFFFFLIMGFIPIIFIIIILFFFLKYLFKYFFLTIDILIYDEEITNENYNNFKEYIDFFFFLIPEILYKIYIFCFKSNWTRFFLNKLKNYLIIKVKKILKYILKKIDIFLLIYIPNKYMQLKIYIREFNREFIPKFMLWYIRSKKRLKLFLKIKFWRWLKIYWRVKIKVKRKYWFIEKWIKKIYYYCYYKYIHFYFYMYKCIRFWLIWDFFYNTFYIYFDILIPNHRARIIYFFTLLIDLPLYYIVYILSFIDHKIFFFKQWLKRIVVLWKYLIINLKNLLIYILSYMIYPIKTYIYYCILILQYIIIAKTSNRMFINHGDWWCYRVEMYGINWWKCLPYKVFGNFFLKFYIFNKYPYRLLFWWSKLELKILFLGYRIYTFVFPRRAKLDEIGRLVWLD